MPDALTADSFRPLTGDAFSVDAGDAGKLDLNLLEVRPLSVETAPDDAAGKRVPFALDFRGPVDPVLPQGTYRLENAALGGADIFIVPVGRTEAGTDYEAIFT